MPHHDSLSCFLQRLNQRTSSLATEDFFNKIGHKRTSRADIHTSAGRDAFDVRQLPHLVEKRLVGSVETKRHEPRPAPCCRDPIVFLSSRSLWGEVDVDRPVAVLNG